jgi:O-antigen/teichoic acid export membrane protein
MTATPRGFLGRVTMGMSGQAFSRLILAAYTILLVPLLIRAWGVDGYGQWIALTALASYMGLSNFGLVTTSANEIVIATGAGDEFRASRTFQMGVNLTVYIVLPVIVCFVLLFSLTPVSRWLNLTQIDPASARAIVACCGASLWFQTFRGVMVAALYATGSYGFTYYLQGALKLIELIGIACVVSVFGGTQLSAAVLITIITAIEALIIAMYAFRAAPWARIDLRVFDKTWLKTQVRPMIGFMVSNFATGGLMSQGPRVILSALLGGSAVAVYAIYGTAMRIVDQLLLTLVLPLEVEIAHNAGAGNLARIYRLILIGTHISWCLFVAVGVGLMCFGPLIFQLWTAGHVAFSYELMALYLCMSAANLLGRVGLHALTSTNRLFKPSIWILSSAVGALSLGAVLTTLFGVPGMVAGGIAGEFANSLIVIGAVAHWLGRAIAAMVGDLIDVKASVGELAVRCRSAWYRLRLLR